MHHTKERIILLQPSLILLKEKTTTNNIVSYINAINMSQFDAAAARENLSKKDWNADDDDATSNPTASSTDPASSAVDSAAPVETKTAEAVVLTP